jgi:hypothetical protein
MNYLRVSIYIAQHCLLVFFPISAIESLRGCISVDINLEISFLFTLIFL